MLEEVPKSEDVEEHHRITKPIYVPFSKDLFGFEGGAADDDSLVALQTRVDAEAGAELQSSSFGAPQIYHSMPSMVFQKGRGAPVPYGRGDTREDSEIHVAAVQRKKDSAATTAVPRRKKDSAATAVPRRKKGSATSADKPKRNIEAICNWEYTSTPRPERPSASDMKIWSKIGKDCTDMCDDSTWTIVDVVKNSSILYFKYISQGSSDDLKYSDDDTDFEFTACTDFFGNSSDFTFDYDDDDLFETVPTTSTLKRNRLQRGSNLIDVSLQDASDSDFEEEEEEEEELTVAVASVATIKPSSKKRLHWEMVSNPKPALFDIQEEVVDQGAQSGRCLRTRYNQP